VRLIEIIEVAAAGDAGFQAYVKFADHPRRFPITITDPADPVTERLLNWYFEGYQRFPVEKVGKSQEAERALEAYGKGLFDQVFDRAVADGDLYRQYARCRDDGLEKYTLRISGHHAFHRLHWEALRDPREELPLAVTMPVERWSAGVENVFPLPEPGPTLNILVVSARPLGAGRSPGH
jgi:hypothetical protein